MIVLLPLYYFQPVSSLFILRYSVPDNNRQVVDSAEDFHLLLELWPSKLVVF